MSDRDRLAGYVQVWRRAVTDLLDLLEQLDADDWRVPTDLPGWNVHAVAAHVAHLERVLSGGPEEVLQFDPPPHVRGLMGYYTEQGVVARRDTSPQDLIAEIRSSADARHAALLADPPTDGRAPAPRTPAGIAWNTETLLRNRPLDVWMHEQDIRRAVDRHGNLDSPGADHTATQLAEALGLVLAKRVAAPPGTTLVAYIGGSEPFAVVVDGSGRGRRQSEIPESPTVALHTDRESFVLLAGGRRTPPEGAVRIEGEGPEGEELGRRVLAEMAVTP